MLKPKNKWPYKSLDDPKYIKQKKEFFLKNGNGWWYTQGVHIYKHNVEKKEN